MQTESFLRPVSILNKSIKILLNRVVGPAVFIWFTYSIYHQVMQQPNLEQSLRYIGESVYGPHSWKLWTAVCLSVINWLTEARKWQVLMLPLQQLSLRDAFKGTLAGVAFAVNTPNRIGEYGGRMIYLRKEHRLQSVSLTIIGSISQLIVTLMAGLVGLLAVRSYFISVAAPYISGNWLTVFICVTILFTTLCTLFYFRLRWAVFLFQWMRLPEKWLRHVKIIENIDVTILLRVLGLSAFRYVIFVCQYILLLQALQIDVPVVNAFWLISILYLILALIPTVTLLELGVRGKTGVLLLQGFSANTIGIYTGGMAIWMINLIIPALAGSIFAARLKVFNIKQ